MAAVLPTVSWVMSGGDTIHRQIGGGGDAAAVLQGGDAAVEASLARICL